MAQASDGLSPPGQGQATSGKFRLEFSYPPYFRCNDFMLKSLSRPPSTHIVTHIGSGERTVRRQPCTTSKRKRMQQSSCLLPMPGSKCDCLHVWNLLHNQHQATTKLTNTQANRIGGLRCVHRLLWAMGQNVLLACNQKTGSAGASGNVGTPSQHSPPKPL